MGFATGLLLAGCHAPRASAAAPRLVTRSEPPAQLRFGSGGGFTGAVVSYTLYADGRLERRQLRPGADTTQPATPLPPVAPARAAACLRAFAELSPPDSLALLRPGNLTYFLDGPTPAGARRRLTWGAPGPVPHAVRALYHSLTALLPGAAP